jgi:hypothetical protein
MSAGSTWVKQYLIFIFLLWYYNLSAQVETVGIQLWTDYNIKIPVSDKFGYGGDVGFRRFVTNYDWNQIYIRPRVTYRLTPDLQLAGGVAYFRTNFQNENRINEFRMFQDFVLVGPNLNYIIFSWRLRFEERFFNFKNLPNDWYIRARYMAIIGSKDIKIARENFYLQAMFEGFKPIIKQASNEIFIDQIRIMGIVGHRVNPYWRYELHYMLQNTRQFSENGFVANNHIIRIRVFHTLIKKDKNMKTKKAD